MHSTVKTLSDFNGLTACCHVPTIGHPDRGSRNSEQAPGEEVPLRFLSLLILTSTLAACGSAPAPVQNAASPAVPAVKVVPHERWEDAVLYFVITDRFADGDTRNNRQVNPKAKGTFHGGDLAGLRQQLDQIAELGVTAIWITSPVDQIDGFVTGAGFPDWGYHGYWADDFTRMDPRFGSEEELKALV